MEQPQDEERATNLKGLKRCIYVILWLISAVLYVMQLVFGIWSAVIQVMDEDYVMFSIIVAPIVFPMVLLSLISIVWYHDQDKVNKYLQYTHPTDQSFHNFKPLLRVGVALSHVTGLGVLYRYCQLMISVARNSKSCDILALQRDSLLLQFLVGFLSNAPLIMVHIYQLLPDMASGQIVWAWPMFPITFSSLVVAILSLLLTLFTYIVNDRLHSETRRIVYPAHITAFIWHVTMVAGRIMTLALFGIAFGPYVSIVIAVHWVSTIVWGLFEKTNICGDVTRTPPKKRLYFEFPFVIVISFVFLFVYFNIRDGSTKIRIIIYHVLTAIETLVLNALFYAVRPNFPLSIWLFAVTVSLYIVGVAFMVLYYAAYHPSRTNDCFKLGIPYACDCCYVFHKTSSNEMANVDLPWGNEDENSENTGVVLQQYNPLANLSMLTERQSGFTIGQVSRSLNATPTGTPQHQVGGVSPFVRQSSGRISTTSSYNPTNDQTNASLRTARQYKSGTRPGLGMEYRSSTPNITYQPRAASVSMEMRPFTPNMRSMSFSEDVGMSTVNGSGIRQLSTIKRPASETIDTSHSIFNHSTPVHRPRNNNHSNARRSRHSVSTGPGGHYLPDRISVLMNNETRPNGRTTPVTRQDNPAVFNPLSTITGGSQMYGNYSGGMIALPSPIGEEPMEGRFDMVSPVIVQVNGMSYSDASKTQNGNNSTPEPLYATPFNHHVNNRLQKDVNYTDFTPSRKVIRSMYVDTPTHTPISRRRSLSPVPIISRSNGHTSPNFKSTNCTPRASPFPGRRHRNPSNPLHTHDPMKEFTQLYSTKHNGAGTTAGSNRTSNPATGELRVPSSSSCVISSDNQTDSDEETTRNTLLNAKSGSIHQPTTSVITSNTTLQIPVSIGSNNGIQKVTAHRQNSEEFLITKLHNITGTLV